MRKLAMAATLSALAATAVGGVYMAKRSSGEEMTADVVRNLQMAATPAQRTGVVSAIEQGLNGAPSDNSKGRRMVVPTKKRAPTAAPSPTVMEVAATTPSSEAPETATASAVVQSVAAPNGVAIAASDAVMPETHTMAAAPGNMTDGSGADRDRGSNDAGSGSGVQAGIDVHGTGINRRGGIGNQVAGAIIRGAAAPIDKCERYPRRGSITADGSTIAEVGGLLAGGNAAPRGTIASGPTTSRKW